MANSHKKRNIPLCRSTVGSNELSAIKRVLDSQWLAHGSMNEELEEMFAGYIGVKRAVTVNSCTSGLQLALEANGIRGEVICPSFTFVATYNAIVTAGAIPVFADIDPATCNISADSIEKMISSRTEAIIVVHFAGQTCQMDKIVALTRKHRLLLIEDSAETIGGTFKGKQAGSFGVGCFSFFPTKNITTGEGGMVTTNSVRMADKIKTLASHGVAKGTMRKKSKGKKYPWQREAVIVGYNYRMCNILAAVGVEQFKKLDSMNDARRKHAAYLNRYLSRNKNISVPIEADGCHHVYQMYTVQVEQRRRDALVLALRERGIEASVHFDPPVHKQCVSKQKNKKQLYLPVTEKVSSSIITLPMYPDLKKIDLDYMIDVFCSIINQYS